MSFLTELIVALSRRALSEYPHLSGDVTVLGPEVFASTETPEAETVICWQGVNFRPASHLRRDTGDTDHESPRREGRQEDDMSFPDGPMQDDALVSSVLGEKCPHCGWRRGAHRPAGEFTTACPTLTGDLT